MIYTGSHLSSQECMEKQDNSVQPFSLWWTNLQANTFCMKFNSLLSP